MCAIDIVLLSIYVIGLIAVPIGIGFWQKDDNWKNFDLVPDGVPLFLVTIFWPLGLAVAIVIGLLFVLLSGPVYIVGRLSTFGGKLYNWFDDWRYERMRRKQEEACLKKMEENK